MKCIICGKDIEKEWRKDKQILKTPLQFCSRSCSNTRTFTKEQNKKKGRSGDSNHSWKNGITVIRIPCIKCGILISQSNKTGYCNKCIRQTEEYRFNLSQSLRGRTGGYREGSGKSKHGYYKGIYCGSSYELAWVIYRLDHNLPVTRFSGKLSFNGEHYIPDFIQNGIIIEIKGIKNSKNEEKQRRVAKANGFTLKVLYREDLEEEFNWCKSNYSYKNLWELYEGASKAVTCKICNKTLGIKNISGYCRQHVYIYNRAC